MKLFIEPDSSRLLTNIGGILAKEGIPSYLVGGFVRDILLERKTSDIDIAVGTDALRIASRVADALGGRYVPLDEENGVGRVIIFDGEAGQTGNSRGIDFTTLKGAIEQDLAQRDFTINAMAIKLNEQVDVILDAEGHIDPFNGRDDLHRGTVRVVSETAFEADAARLIRAVRIAAELGFCIDSDTERLIRECNQLIAGVSGERVREELLRLLAIPGAGQRLAYLDELGLLTALIPELAPARGVDQPKIHTWDVFDHSIQTVSAVEFLLREGNWEHAGKETLDSVPWSENLKEHFCREVSSGSTRTVMLKLAALLHDIAKPATKTVDEDGRARFLGHPQEGADTAAAIMERLRFSNREIKLVELLIKHHLRPTQMSHEDLPTRRAIYRYFRDTGEAGIDILFLCLADHLATRGPNLEPLQWQEHTRMTDYILTAHLEEETISRPPKLINGHDIIKIFGVSPGPVVGELLEALRETQAAGEVTTRQQALDYIEKLVTDRSGKSGSEPSQGEK